MRYLPGCLLLACAAACSSQRAAVALSGDDPPSQATLSFIEDDYPRALAQARAQHVPIFVEAWAPW
jgi:hypothetical protein